MTDFGYRDPYVGIMKGVILSRALGVTLVDLCHLVPAQQVESAAFFLGASIPYFPDDTLFVAVIDPGVGTKRSVLWGRNKRGQQFLVPDNGLLDRVGAISVRRVTNRSLFLPQVSATFHGRDIFAPIAAALANGLNPEGLGPVAAPVRRLKKKTACSVLHVDHFGNAVTSISGAAVARGKTIWIGKNKIGPLKKTYSSVKPGAALALVGSYGLVECSVRDGDFAAKFNVRSGDRVYVR